MRIGFLFNHYGAHQVPHAAPYAFEISRRHPNFEVVIACSSAQEVDLVESISSIYPSHRCEIIRLRTPLYYRPLDPLMSKWILARKQIVLSHHIDFFRSLDALVAPERHCMKLRMQFGLSKLKMIRTRHGAGDRKGGFDDHPGTFDLTILPGKKYVDRLRDLGMLNEDGYAVAGWPKFEVVRGLNRPIPRLFNNDNPTVVYNPHFDQTVSSWREDGIAVLDFFAKKPDYNLIFAPHLVLFVRSGRHGAYLPRKYARRPNIWVDKGSPALSDMTYMLAADIYLGDVSSQVYEFLLEPRPCIFLNSHNVQWEKDRSYLHWTLGQVIHRVNRELGAALECAFTTHKDYLSKQREAFEYTFQMAPDSTAAERGADAIADFLSQTKTAAPQQISVSQ